MSNFEDMTDKECPVCYAPLFIEEAEDPMDDDTYTCHRCGWMGFEYEC